MIKLAPMKNMIVLPSSRAFSVWGNVYVKGWEAFDRWRMRALSYSAGRRMGKSIAQRMADFLDVARRSAEMGAPARTLWVTRDELLEMYPPNEKPRE